MSQVARIFVLLTILLPLSSTVFAQSPTIELTKAEAEFIRAHPVIKVANEMDWPPFDFNEYGRPKGMSIDYISLLAEKAGLRIEFVYGHSWDELLNLFESKQIDVMPVLYRNKEREAYTLYSRPYYKGKLGIFTHEDGLHLTKLSDLLRMRVGIQKGHGSIPIIQELVPGIQLVEDPSTSNLVKLLGTRKLDAIIGNPLLFSHFARENQVTKIHLSDYVNMSPEEQLKTSFHVGVRTDYPVLNKILGKAMEAVTSAELEAVQSKWSNFRVSDNQISLTSEERAYLNGKGGLTVCVDPNWMPYEQISDSGRHNGMSADYFELFSKRLGVKFTLFPTTSWNETLDAAKARKCDLISLAKPTEDRKAYLDFTTPYLSFPYVVATRNDQFFIEDIEKELDKTFTVVRGYAVVDELRQNYPQMKLIEVNDILEGLDKVLNGEAFGYIGATAVVANTLREYSIVNIKIGGQLPWGFELGVATRNDEPLLHNLFQAAIATLTPGEQDRIKNKWTAISVQKVIDYKLILQIVGGGATLFILFAYWTRKLGLAKRNTEKALKDLHAAQKQLKQKNRQLKTLSVTDDLTKLYNRVKLHEVLQVEFQRFDRTKKPFSLILLDVDHFKQVNDTHGHQVGDKVLVAMAKCIKSNVRTIDTAGRWGGEEFLIICPDTNKKGVVTLAEHLRGLIEKQKFPVIKAKTASMGVTVYKKSDTLESILARADKALYTAKNKGRNRVETL